MTEPKLTVAVFYGGRSPEHDVSVVSALQAMQALDRKRFDVVPVYIDVSGRWWTGEALFQRSSYLPDETLQKQLTELTLDLTPAHGTGLLVPLKSKLFGGVKPIEFDVALPVVHGTTMEDGCLQGLLELIGVPYAGMRLPACTLAMDKVQTKHLCRSLEIPCLPFTVLQRPIQGLMLAEADLKKQVKGVTFPAIVKPVHLGSSIGVAKVDSVDELAAVLPEIFKYDAEAMVEPFVPNLVEYNVAVSCAYNDGALDISAIERPKSTKELLDFKEKYCNGGGKKTGSKEAGQLSEGMLSLTRELNPKVAKKLASDVESWAKQVFTALGRTGAPRIDFLSNSKTGEIWLNEINPCPGSLGYFLWEAKQQPVLFTAQLSAQIEEALAVYKRNKLPHDPVPEAARLLKRPGI
jgi:D-alanine-D-alanine ligase